MKKILGFSNNQNSYKKSSKIKALEMNHRRTRVVAANGRNKSPLCSDWQRTYFISRFCSTTRTKTAARCLLYLPRLLRPEPPEFGSFWISVSIQRSPHSPELLQVFFFLWIYFSDQRLATDLCGPPSDRQAISGMFFSEAEFCNRQVKDRSPFCSDWCSRSIPQLVIEVER